MYRKFTLDISEGVKPFSPTLGMNIYKSYL